jgi:cob(I)alamin adenosyltransferase
MSNRLSIESIVATGRGDDGTTGLLYSSERVPKDDPRAEAYGTVDEAVAALGLARAELGLKEQYGVLAGGLVDLPGIVLRLQRELFVVGAELATPLAESGKLTDGVTRVTPGMIEGLESILVAAERRIEMPKEFVVPGETRVSAALELARTVVRRAERRVVSLARSGVLGDSLVVPYLNRLADLLWVLARADEQAEAHRATPARPQPGAGA